MRIRVASVLVLLLALLSRPAFAATAAEIKLIDPLDETRSWCVDLFAHLKGALPIGGFQAHSCFLYMGLGPTEDQGFDSELYLKEGRLRLMYFNVCLTMHEPKAGSFVAAEPCVEEGAQKFRIRATGEIESTSAPGLCLTTGPRSVPGGGATPVHLIRRLTFEKCDARIASRQRWELRYAYKEAIPTLPRPYD